MKLSATSAALGLVACRTEANVSSGSATAASLATGYLGYAAGANTYTGTMSGVRGLCHNIDAASGVFAIWGTPIFSGATLAADKIVSLGGYKGHLLVNSGSGALVDDLGSSYDTPNAITTTHLDFVNNTGELYVENALEVDGTAYLDGDLDHNGTNLGVFSTAPTTKQTVTGSRGGNAALASLLTALAAYGLVTDSSTA